MNSTAPSPAHRATALVADDEPHLARALVAELAAAWPALQVVHVARNGVEAAEHIAALRPDLAFLDIQMPGLTGLEVAEGIEGPTRVVFVTAYEEYAVDAFEREALDYVLKPAPREVHAAGAIAATPAPPPGPLRWIRAGSGDLVHQVPVDEVLFFRADDKYTCVHTAGGAEHLIRTPIHELAQALDPRGFVQVHRSTIVNLRHLAGTRRDEASRLFLRLRGHSAELPVSRAYVHLFRAM